MCERPSSVREATTVMSVERDWLMLVISLTRTSLISTRSLQRSEPAKSTKLSLLRSMLPLNRCSTTTCTRRNASACLTVSFHTDVSKTVMQAETLNTLSNLTAACNSQHADLCAAHLQTLRQAMGFQEIEACRTPQATTMTLISR